MTDTKPITLTALESEVSQLYGLTCAIKNIVGNADDSISVEKYFQTSGLPQLIAILNRDTDSFWENFSQYIQQSRSFNNDN